ncbi:MAG TPA: PKD domain-containing protein, partial [Anaerolineae bacterium]|nr:PKD domain-containing protein [Anaerolineae bacterium]
VLPGVVEHPEKSAGDELDFNDKTSSLRFVGDEPSTSVSLVWDLDGDGVFGETGAAATRGDETGETPTFDAADLDGPTQVNVTLRVTFSGVISATDTVVIEVMNVAPIVSIDSITDATTGLEIGPGLPLPVALVWLEVNVAGSFTDPGTADTHTATMDWGDGTSDDLGDVVNAVSAAHVYATPGEYTIALVVTDDDGGVGTATAQIKVVDGAGAIQEVTNELEALLAQPDLGGDAREAIEDALDKLRGNNGGQADNGALDKLEQGTLNAALEKIKHALQDMAVAETADPNLDLTSCKSLLTLAAKSLALEAIAQAKAVSTNPTDLRKIEQANDLVTQGDALWATSDYVGGGNQVPRSGAQSPGYALGSRRSLRADSSGRENRKEIDVPFGLQGH